MKFITQLFTLIYISIKKGGITDKASALVVGAVLNVPFTELTEKYIFNDWEMLGYVGVLLIVDTATGLVKHWNNNTISSEGFKKLFFKIIICGAALITAHVLNSIATHKGGESIGDYVETTCYSGIIIFLAISIAENLKDISNGRFPPLWIRKHLSSFEKTGKPATENDLDVTSSKDET
jgi:phage-related holin